ncbi:MAG: Gfo/Idh/MocA family oxidoreductase [Planctomycetales bacterium]|nr:Gfo/Idh/MocA family oxidoreductase [Planctomycetales bacterium]
MSSTSQVNVLMVGSGEYTTGYVHGAAAKSDKGAGVVALTLFDLRRRGLVDRLSMAGTNGTKFPGIRSHLQQVIADRYHGMEIAFESFPSDTVPSDPDAYHAAIRSLNPGDVVTVFTPDDLHLDIAVAAVEHGCHVLVAKPLVKTIREHQRLISAAQTHNCLVAVEVHKRWDPLYADARDRIRSLGDFSYFTSYMSQPKSQLSTFSAWAGKSSDISYYLNTHHIDFHLWALSGIARPLHVSAVAAQGWAVGQSIPTEDTISLQVEFEHLNSSSRGVAIYTASWIAPRSDVHSQQRFFYLGHQGEIQVDQAHRGYSTATDDSGFASINPLFMKYTPSPTGEFAGQLGYGYRSIEAFVQAANAIRAGHKLPSDFHDELATAHRTLAVTAVLEAGRLSLDNDGRRVTIDYDEDGQVLLLRF